MKKPSKALPTRLLKLLRAGDIIACSGSCIQSDIINLFTCGVPRRSLSHLMILAEDANDLLLFESTTQCDMPCAIRGLRLSGTQAHYIGPRLQGYRGKVWHYPLATPLRTFERRHLSRFLKSELGRPYDAEGAIEAGGKLWNAICRRLHPESLSALFCSEWVAAALKSIERFDTPSASAWSPNGLIREANRRGILAKPRRLK